MSAKRMLVNADDFGFTTDVNEGIVEAHREGILTATTLMANGAAFDDAVRLAHENPALDVGCHLVLVGGHSLLPPFRPLPASVPELLLSLAAGRIRVYDELEAQLRRIRAAGIRPLHLDTHKHTHLAPPVLRAVARLAREFGIPWVRRPFDLPLTGGRTPWSVRAVNRGLQRLRATVTRALEAQGCRSTDHFAGFQLTGRFHTAELVRLLETLPPGVTEFMCHPGRCRAPLMAAPTRLKQSRERELEALLAPQVRQAARGAAVEFVSFRQLLA